jgi:hypothetical protein
VLTLFGVTVDLHAESNQSGSRQAVLHISVVVMPVIQAIKIAPSQPQIGSVSYNLNSPPRETRYEVRAFPQGTTAHGDKRPAVLKTLVVVPQ